jgi:putative exosortase-associated protein (TIGR04073 family)
MNHMMKGLCLSGLVVMSACLLPSQLGSAEEGAGNLSLPAPQENTAVTQPKTEASSTSESMTRRAQSGFSNIVYGPLEPIYQLREEVKKTDPVRGFIPGLFKGVGWCLAREFVGVYELLTFHQPHKQTLKEFDTEWIYA